jgi:4-diphosphocytidyl-2-C-methyl-D-erythritol kinase
VTPVVRVDGAGPHVTEAKLSLFAPAKVNLFLRVLAREESGYHQLETLFQFLEFGDRITLERTDGEGVELELAGDEAEGLGPPERNLAVRAARSVLDRAAALGEPHRGGIRILLEKRIPHGAGLGGGSSDAATVLQGVNRLLGEPLPKSQLLELAAALGSDVPVFLSPSPTTLAWGRGDRLLPLPPLPSASVVLAVPPFRIPTPEAFAELAGWRKERAAAGEPGRGASLMDPGSLAGWGGVVGAAGNDLQAPVFRRWPRLVPICEAMEASGAAMALLSGSGAALFAVFPREGGAAEASPALQARFPDVRFVHTRTLGAAQADGDPGA